MDEDEDEKEGTLPATNKSVSWPATRVCWRLSIVSSLTRSIVDDQLRIILSSLDIWPLEL